MKALTIFLIAAAMLGAMPRDLRADDAFKECDKAQKAWNEGHPEKAQKKLEEILRKWPGYERARVMLGLLRVQYARDAEKSSQWDLAVEEYGQALTLDPDEPYWMSALARALESKGEAQGAGVECAEAARLSPLDAGLAHGCGLKSAAPSQNHDPSSQGAGEKRFPMYKLGIDITEPVPLNRPEPPYTDKARQAKYQGTTVVSVVVGPDGTVQETTVIRALGLGLDESALQTLQTWTFKPSTLHGQPVPMRVLVEIAFRLH